ncbi:MAG: ThuA domain-containing protein [Pirellulaceae bacterium]
MSRWFDQGRATAVVALAWAAGCLSAVSQEPADPAAWTAEVEKNAPARPTAALKVDAPRNVLVFSLATGYQHSVIPYVDQVFQIVGRKSGAFTATISRDIEDLTPESLSRFDVLVLNNTCSVGPRRNLLLDVLETDPRYKDLTEQERQLRAAGLEQAMLDFVHSGKGLVAMHGAPTLLNNSAEFTKMVGGAFDYHPPSQQVTVRVVEANHPLLSAWHAQAPFVHQDEPYCFTGPYDAHDFRPLLAFETQGVQDPQGRFDAQVRYAAWIKPYGKGRVFFCSPGHYAESYTNPALLQFVLDGTQYAAGDLDCADAKH